MASKPKVVDQEEDDVGDRKAFSSILDTPAMEVTRPKPPPHGTYVAMTRGLPNYGKSAKKGTPYSEYTMQFIEPRDDVDEEGLEEYLTKGDGTKVSLHEKTTRITFYHTEDAKWRLVKFLKDLGLEAEDKSVTIGDLEDQSPGRQCLIHIKHTLSDDGETTYGNVDKTAPLED